MNRWISVCCLLFGASACAEVSVAAKTTALERDARALRIEHARFFPEGVAVDKAGNFYIGSMELGAIYRGTASTSVAQPFIEPNDENQLVSVLGLLADDATNTLYVCSSDAGNAARSGTAPAAVKAFDLASGAFRKSYAWPAFSGTQLPADVTKGVNGFCNDLTLDADGNLYATDSWYPRVLKLAPFAEVLEEWLVSDVFPQDQWHLNGIDVDQSSNTLYVVENHPGALYAVPIRRNGSPGRVSKLSTSRELLGPDGLKVAAPGLLVVAEGGNQGGGVSTLHVRGGQAEVKEVAKGFDQVATLALFQSSAWVVENQGDHFWSPDESGRDATPPFRVVEVPLKAAAGARTIEIAAERFFPEGVTLDDRDNFYVGSMSTGAIHKASAAADRTEPFIAPNAENGLVSVLGLHADGDTLWVCSSDAGNGELAGRAPAALKAFELPGGALKGSWAWPAFSKPLPEETTKGVTGFCNDIAVDDAGNVYATDSWYPRILRLRPGADALEEWVVSDVFPQDQWHLNGIDIDRRGRVVYVVENHPGALYAIPIERDGSAGSVRAVATSRPLYAPDGLKVLGSSLLAVAEGEPGGIALIELGGGAAHVRRINTGLDGIATFAVRSGSAWLVENQGDHFWGEASDALEPFRLVEVPLR